MSQTVPPDDPSEAHPTTDNYNFVQVSRSYLREMRGLARKSPVAHEILYYFVEHMGRTTNAVVCSRNVLAEVTGCSIATVGRAIRVLKDDNWIDTVKIGNASAYCIAAASEQDSDFREKAKQKLTYIPVIEDSDIAVAGKDQLPPPDQQDLDI